ncbi:MAG: hypothetical protein OSB60_05125 [Myxococcota bacterium]|nr:hypothetical protein [Myxococcota bacterium]
MTLHSSVRVRTVPGRTSNQTRNVDLEAALRSTQQLLGQALSDANVEVTVDVQEALPL